jgi:hypothetical protein
MLNLVMPNATINPFRLSVIMLNLVMPNATNNPFMLSVIMLSVIMLNVFMPNVVAPSKTSFSTSEPRRLLLPHRPGTCVNRKKPVPLRIHRRRSGQVVPGIEPTSVSRLHRRLPLVDDRHADVAHPPVFGSLRFGRMNFFNQKIQFSQNFVLFHLVHYQKLLLCTNIADAYSVNQ